MYFHCPQCSMKFKYEQDMISVFADAFGQCPVCGAAGVFEKDVPCAGDDRDYLEVEEFGDEKSK